MGRCSTIINVSEIGSEQGAVVLMKKLLDYKVGEAIDLYLLIKQSTKGVTTQGSPFMRLVLQDKSGDLEAKLWDTTDEHVKTYMQHPQSLK